jgi:hypothetical protein
MCVSKHSCKSMMNIWQKIKNKGCMAANTKAAEQPSYYSCLWQSVVVIPEGVYSRVDYCFGGSWWSQVFELRNRIQAAINCPKRRRCIRFLHLLQEGVDAFCSKVKLFPIPINIVQLKHGSLISSNPLQVKHQVTFQAKKLQTEAGKP